MIRLDHAAIGIHYSPKGCSSLNLERIVVYGSEEVFWLWVKCKCDV